MFNRIDRLRSRLIGSNIKYVITSKQNRLHSRKSLHEAYRDCTTLHILLILQNTDVYYFLFIEKIGQSTHSGTFHCPGITWPGRGPFLSIPGLSRAARDIWSPYPQLLVFSTQVSK